MRNKHHIINEEYGDYIYRKEGGDFTLFAIGYLFIIFGIITILSYIWTGEILDGLIFGVISILIGNGILKLWKIRQRQLSQYAQRRKKHGAAIHDYY